MQSTVGNRKIKSLNNRVSNYFRVTKFCRFSEEKILTDTFCEPAEDKGPIERSIIAENCLDACSRIVLRRAQATVAPSGGARRVKTRLFYAQTCKRTCVSMASFNAKTFGIKAEVHVIQRDWLFFVGRFLHFSALLMILFCAAVEVMRGCRLRQPFNENKLCGHFDALTRSARQRGSPSGEARWPPNRFA